MPKPSVVHTQLTDIKVAKLSNISAGLSDFFARDSNLSEFGVRVSPNNVKSFFVEATLQGRFTRRVIGRFPLLSVSEVRKRALEALRALKYGEGLRSNKTTNLIALIELAEIFLKDKQTILRQATLRDYTRIIQGPYFAPWMNQPVHQVMRRSVMERYQYLCSEHGIGMANKSMRVLNSVLNYSKALYPNLEDWPNPIAVLSETRSRKPLRPRTSHIPVESLGTWLAALDSYVSECKTDVERSRREDIRFLLKLLLMTGLRSTEGRSLRWSDLDLQRGVLTVPAERAKNHREARLPLNSWLIQQLTTRSSSTSEYVFPNRGAGGYIRNLRRPLERLGQLSGLELTPHDLRRSYATYLDAIGAPFGVIKQLLNHASSSDVTERYIQRRGIEELRKYSEDLLVFITEKSSCRPVKCRATD